MKDIKQTIQEIESSKEFKNWVKTENGAYLSSVFTMVGDSQEIDWQLDYYSPKKNTLTSFVQKNGNVKFDKDQKIFKKDGKVEKLDIDKLKITLDECIKSIKKKNPDEKAVKIIVILQNKNSLIWNVTFLTSGLKVLNSKINAENGKFLLNEVKPILEFQAS